VEREKPHPEPYRRAAALLDVAPEACVVFEDSPSGVRAGKAAGCRVLAVPTEHILDPSTVTEPADAAFSSLLEAFHADAWQLP